MVGEYIKITRREEYLRLAVKSVEENMSKLPMSADALVVKLIMVAFDTGYELAKCSEAEVEL